MGVPQAFDDVGRRVGVGGAVHDRGHGLRQDSRLGHVVLSFDLDIVEIRPQRTLVPEGMTQINKLHLSHGYYLQRSH